MSLDFEYHTSRFRRHQIQWADENDKRMPFSQAMLSWGIVLFYIVLVCDHGWWAQAIKEREDKGNFPGTPTYNQALADFSANSAEIDGLLTSGMITPDDTVRLQYRGIQCLDKMGKDWSGFSAGFYEKAQEVYARRWKPTDGDKVATLNCKTEADREAYAKWNFQQKFLEAQATAKRPDCLAPLEFRLDTTLYVLYWIVKWYFLMTVPVLMIVLVGKRYEGLSIKEEFLLQPVRLGLACLAGPIGTFSLSGVAAKVYCYGKLKREFLADKASDYRLNSEDEQALWIQVYKPVMTFDQALDSLKSTGKGIRRPIMACLLTGSFAGFTLFHASTQIRGVVQEVAVASTVLNDSVETILEGAQTLLEPLMEQATVLEAAAESTAERIMESTHQVVAKWTSSLVTMALLAILPGLLVWPVAQRSKYVVLEIAQPTQQPCWRRLKPRGPPSLAKRQQRDAQKALILLATNAEEEE